MYQNLKLYHFFFFIRWGCLLHFITLLHNLLMSANAELIIVELISEEEWCSELAYLFAAFRHLNRLIERMYGKNGNLLLSTDNLQEFGSNSPL